MGFSEIKTEKISENIILHFLHIEEIDEEIDQIIKNSIVRICEWRDSNVDIHIIKQELRERLEAKRWVGLENEKWRNLEIWLISEFFVHLYLNYIGFKQECLYVNSEEPNSIKKWFDWLYSDDNGEIWLVESKSWNITTQHISHKNKIDEAYTDLSEKISWNSVNSSGVRKNPRWNACTHALRAGSQNSLYQEIKEFDRLFRNWIYWEIENFNIIPASTIFFDWKIAIIEDVEKFGIVKQNIISRLNGKNIKKWHILCFSQKTKDLLINYLELD